MQDIPRNELLDKLAAGWKVRRKDWENGVTITKHRGNASCHWVEMLKGDWEGEPPGLARIYEGCAIIFAFEKLRDGAAFIRRAAWEYEGPITPKKASYVHVSNLDILANDWEVWA